MSSESVVIRGKLKLKVSSSSSILGKKRKSSEPSSVDQSNNNPTSIANTNNILTKKTNNGSQEQSSSNGGYTGNLTETQRKFMKRKQEVDSKSVKALTATTYRDRVESFNQKLSNMTEHNDIPRISAAGNG